MDPMTRLKASIDQTRPTVAAPTPDQFEASTPCPDWDVQALAGETFEFAQTMFASPEIRAGSVGDPVVVADGADAMSKLVAFLGRTR